MHMPYGALASEWARPKTDALANEEWLYELSTPRLARAAFAQLMLGRCFHFFSLGSGRLSQPRAERSCR
jgi:hypothetical protein